jgi:hypothetical protein
MQELRAPIFAPVITQLVADGRELMTRVREAEDTAQVRRYELGKLLLKARGLLPKRGTPQDGWGHFLEAIELDEATAWRYMKLAEAVEADPAKFHVKGKLEVPTYADLGLDKRQGPQLPETPAPRDEDAPAELLDHAAASEEPKANRDAWCTNEAVALALPKKLDLDPCSNPFSIVKAKTKYMRENGDDGLALPWFGLMYVNGPFSKLLPWAERLAAELAKPRSQRKVLGVGFMVNADNSPEWWHTLVAHLHLRLDFDDRLEFIPPPGVEPSKNDRPQTLLMTPTFWAACDRRALLKLGTLWKQSK